MMSQSIGRGNAFLDPFKHLLEFTLDFVCTLLVTMDDNHSHFMVGLDEAIVLVFEFQDLWSILDIDYPLFLHNLSKTSEDIPWNYSSVSTLLNFSMIGSEPNTSKYIAYDTEFHVQIYWTPFLTWYRIAEMNNGLMFSSFFKDSVLIWI